MAGAGIEVEINEAEIQEIIDALNRASAPQLEKIAKSAADELEYISEKAFEREQNPATGERWAKLKHPRGEGADTPGSTGPILTDYGHLRRTLIYEAFPDGSVIFGSNVIYSRIHQEGGEAGRGHASKIPARPFLGVPQDFDRKFLSDPEILKLLGIGH